MLTAFARFGDGKISRDTSPQALSAALADPQARLWLDMENPSAEELSLLDTVFHFHPLAIEDATHRAQRPKLEDYTQIADVCQHGYYYMVIHGPDLVTFIRENARVYFRDVQDHLIRTVETVELYRDLIMGARDIYLSSVSNRLNQIMKTLTVVSVIAMPVMMVTSFFGMNFERMPAIHSPTGFWITMSFTALVEVVLFWMIKKKGWL